MIVDNKTFLKTVKPLLSDNISRRDIISLTEDGKTITQDLDIEEIFNSYFSNLIRSLCDGNVPTEPGIAYFQNSVSTATNKLKIVPSFSLLIKTWTE